MNTRSVRLIIALIILGSTLLSLSCGNTGPNANSNLAAANVSNVETAGAATAGDSPCSPGLTIEQRRQKVYDRLVADVDGDTQLKDQYRVRKNFTFDVRVGSDGESLDLYLEGVVGTNNKHEDQLKHLTGWIRGFMKKKCAERVYLLPSGSIGPGKMIRPIDGFLWMGCEYPKNACPNGVCADVCDPELDPGNGNSNANSNSNTGNGNANSSPPGNSNTGKPK